MKRQIKSAERSEVRVINISLDVVIPSDVDGSNIVTMLEDDVNAAFEGKFRIAAADVGGDLTDIYERDYPAEMFI